MASRSKRSGDVRPFLEDGSLHLQTVDVGELSAGEFANQIRRAVEDGAEVVVIDSLTGYFHAMQEEGLLQTQMHGLLAFMAARGVLAVLVVVQHGVVGSGTLAPIDVSYLCDSLILLRNYDASGQIHRAIAVVKKRYSEHHASVREMRSSDGGVHVGEPRRDLIGVLAGAPQISGQPGRQPGETGAPGGAGVADPRSILHRAAEKRVLVLHHHGRNAVVVCRLFADEGLCPESVPDLAKGVREGSGTVVVSGAALAGGCAPLRAALGEQPRWSSLPVVVLAPAGDRGEEIVTTAHRRGPQASVKVLEEPVQAYELVSLVRVALEARRRQYEAGYHAERERVLRAELQASRRELRALNESLEGRVRTRTEQVRALGARLATAEQEERRRLAHVLHDDLQQQLYGLGMTLSLLRRARSDEAAERLLDQAETTLDAATALTRSLAVELSPAVLEAERLSEVFRWLAERARQTYGLTVEVEGESEAGDPELRALLYHPVWEALFNVAKHAQTDQARVVVGGADGRIQVVVEDERVGFNVASLGTSEDVGLGIASVRERLELVGGRFAVESAPGEGTRVTLEVPVAPEDVPTGSG